MACPHIKTCILFPQLSLNSAMKVWQVFYCEGHYDRCARNHLIHAGKSVPTTLLPNGNAMSRENENRAGTPGGYGATAPSPVPAAGPASAAERQQTALIGTKQAPANDPVAESKPPARKTRNPRPVEGTSYYLRIETGDNDGAMAQVAETLMHQHIGIEAMIRRAVAGNGSTISIIILTPPVSADDMTLAVERMRTLTAVSGNVTCIPLERLPLAQTG